MDLTPEAIHRLVTEQEGRTEEARRRMEDDYRLYLLDVAKPEEGYEGYATNEPQTFADMLISMMVLANLIVRFPIDQKQQPQRERDDEKEHFITGILRRADERLADMLMPSLREQLSFFLALRGRYGGRAVFAKNRDGSVTPDIMPWDPLHTFYGMDKDGLAWACYRMYRSSDSLREEFRVEPSSNGHGSSGVALLDYYNKEINCVVAQGEFVKPPTPHMAGRVPVFLGAVGPAPPIFGAQDTTTPPGLHYGESVFKSNRAVYETFNRTMADVRTLVRRSVKQGLKWKVRGGAKEVPSDPYKEGANVVLDTGEDVQPLGLLEMAKETMAFLGQVSGEMQRGSVPHTAFGELQFQLSGFAITQLRQGINARLQPCVTALERCYTQLIRLVIEQYRTEQFGPLMLQGFDDKDRFFSQTFTADNMQGAASYPIVKIVPILPSDDASKYAMAQMAREGNMLPLREIWDKILGLSNVDSLKDMLNEELAEKLNPIAALMSLVASLRKQGRDDLADLFQEDLQRMLMERGAQAGGPAPGGAPAGPPGVSSATLPGGMMGMPPPAPTAPPGLPQQPPGAVRPGALSEEGRLARMGLVPAR